MLIFKQLSSEKSFSRFKDKWATLACWSDIGDTELELISGPSEKSTEKGKRL